MPLRGRTPISPAAQSTIKRAFKDLEQYISITDHKNLQDTTLEDVRQAAHSIEDQLAARQSLRNMRRLLPLFDGLSYYSKTIEVLCNGTPYMAWIWAPIKVILKVASDYVEAFEKIIQGYARIAEPLARFKLFDQAYSKNIHVQETLAVYYADILKFHEHAYKFVRRGGWKNLFHSSWGRFERTFKGIFDDMERHGDSIDKTAAAIHISEAKAMRDALETSRQQSLDALKREEQEMVSSHYLAIVGWLKLDESDQHKILESIASEASNYPGTTDWVTKNPKITSWMRPSHETTFLVLNGHPGTGKSVLASRITTFLKSANASLVISHFCTYSYVTSIEYDQILRSVLAQLIRSNPDLVAHAYDELIRQKKALNSQVLEKLICDLIISSADSPSQTRYIHILLDGLNECDQDQQKKIIRMLERVVSVASSESSGSTICKVLLSTRVTQPVPVRLRQKPTVSIGEEKIEVTKAIRQYSSDRMKRLSGRLKEMQITERDLQDVVNGIADKAAGMFLWARLVLEYLSTNIFYSREEILRAAETLPRKLSEFYGKIITQLLSHLDDRSVKRVKMVLGWIAFAKRPLRKAEFRSALAFGDGDTKVSELPPPYIFDICGPLIEMRKDSSFAFIHVSVKEFLQSPESNIGLSETTACYQHGVSTATCLLSGLETMALACPESERNLRILRGLHAFHTYATEYWTEYLLAIASSSTGLDANSQFFLLSSRLATTLRDLQRGNSDASKDSSSVSDARLVFLEEHPNLHTVAVESISDRGIKDLEEANIADADDGGQVVSVTSLKTLLLCYRTVIGSLLSMQTYGGIELEEFARFKVEYRKTAFACRLLSCPRATLGFDSQAELIEHEASHLRIVCKEPFCQYPPFSSVRALKAHQSKCHPKDTGVARRTGIRQSRAKHFTTDDIGNPNKRENLSVGAKNGSDMRSDTTGEVHQTQESQTLLTTQDRTSYARSILAAILDIAKELQSRGYKDNNIPMKRIDIPGSTIFARFADLVGVLERVQVTLLADAEFWHPVRVGLLRPGVYPGCWGILSHTVVSTLETKVKLDMIGFLEALTTGFSICEQREIWQALLTGLPLSAYKTPACWRLLAKRMTPEIRMDFSSLGWSIILAGLSEHYREDPEVCDAIIRGVPELANHRAQLEFALLEKPPPQAPDEVEDREDDSILSTQLNDPMDLDERSDLLINDANVTKDAESTHVWRDTEMEEDRETETAESPQHAVGIDKVEEILISNYRDVEGMVSPYALERRARRLLRTHGLFMSDTDFHAWMNKFRVTHDIPVPQGLSAPTLQQSMLAITAPKTDFATSEGSTLGGSTSRSASSFRRSEATDQTSVPSESLKVADLDEPNSDEEVDPTQWATQWAILWGIKQRNALDTDDDVKVLALELDCVPEYVKNTSQFWGTAVSEGMSLWESNRLSVFWINTCYHAIPDQARELTEFWDAFVSPLPLITKPVRTIWKTFLAEVNSDRDLRDLRFWRAIAIKTPSDIVVFDDVVRLATIPESSHWLHIFTVIFSQTKKPHPEIWAAFKLGVPSMVPVAKTLQAILDRDLNLK